MAPDSARLLHSVLQKRDDLQGVARPLHELQRHARGKALAHGFLYCWEDDEQPAQGSSLAEFLAANLDALWDVDDSRRVLPLAFATTEQPAYVVGGGAMSQSFIGGAAAVDRLARDLKAKVLDAAPSDDVERGQAIAEYADVCKHADDMRPLVLVACRLVAVDLGIDDSPWQ